MKRLKSLAVGGVFVLGSVVAPSLWRSPQQDLLAFPWFQSNYTWGSDGDNGRSGRDGRNGINGVDQTIYAEGAPLTFDLSGSDGSDGDDGDHGESARCPVYWQEPEHNINGADGGNGGNGGNAGNGGSGGNVTIFYQTPQDLKNIFLNNSGGRAGEAGRGGYGGDGCECFQSYWRVKTCEWKEISRGEGQEPERKEVCETETYYCRSGADGRDGRDGNRGREGGYGAVTLVANRTDIPQDNPQARVTVADLQGGGVRLSKNRWRSQSGLLSKLASGSKAPNDYREYVEFWQPQIQLDWQATESMGNFREATFDLTLGDRRTLSVNQPGDLWLDYQVTESQNGFLITVRRAMAASEATQLIRQSISGQNRDLQLKILDLGDRQEWLDTRFRVKYSTRNRAEFREGYTYTTQYDKVLPPEYVEQNGDEFTLFLGDLPISLENFQSGTGVEIEVIAERSFMDNSTTQTIRWTGILP